MYDPTPWPPRRRLFGVRVVLIATVLAVLGVIPLLGLPGAFIVMVSLPVFGLSEANLHADAAWPIAIYISLLWPVGLILGYWAGFGLLKKQSEGRRKAAMAGVAMAWCLLLSFLFYAGAEKRRPAANTSGDAVAPVAVSAKIATAVMREGARPVLGSAACCQTSTNFARVVTSCGTSVFNRAVVVSNSFA